MDLFPLVTPYSSGFLAVDKTHNLYWEQSGNPDGVPVVLVHGGPGAGATPTHRRFFDPDHYRIIIFDQRGAGRSTPLGSLENNTTAHLVADMEILRSHLRVERWHLFGGSWGSTLSLAYAAKYPNHCISLILRGIFLCEQEEIDWFLYGMRHIFPEAWEQFTAFLPEHERSDILHSYYKYLTGEDPRLKMNAAIAWTLYEGACSSLLPNFETITTEEQKQHALALARIECHYFLNEVRGGTMSSLLGELDTLRKIPATIIQGRYDLICPIRTAYKLHQLWPEADYIVVPDAGHSALDPTVRSRLIEATEHVKGLR
jgi:proline iminopeptidase